MNTGTKNRRKVLVPLATMLVAGAGAVAVGSGADFHAESASSVAVTSGTLLHTNSRDGLTLSIDNIKPGDTKSGSLEITNTGTLDSALTLQETSDSSTFVAGDLKLTIADGSGVVYTGNFGDLDNAVKKALANIPAGEKDTVTFTVSMPTTADNGSQGKAASASYQFVTTPINDKSGLGWL